MIGVTMFPCLDTETFGGPSIASPIEHGMSTSRLARKAGLDLTTFNKSKRLSKEGKLRWPSTESISKILAATGSGVGEFMSYLGDEESLGTFRNIPLIGFAHAGGNGFFDGGGFPVGGSWDEIAFPGVGDPAAYALEIAGDSMEPAYQRRRYRRRVSVGARSPQRPRCGQNPFRGSHGQGFASEIRKRVELQSLNPAHDDRDIPIENVEWIAQIVWASQ